MIQSFIQKCIENYKKFVIISILLGGIKVHNGNFIHFFSFLHWLPPEVTSNVVVFPPNPLLSGMVYLMPVCPSPGFKAWIMSSFLALILSWTGFLSVQDRGPPARWHSTFVTWSRHFTHYKILLLCQYGIPLSEDRNKIKLMVYWIKGQKQSGAAWSIHRDTGYNKTSPACCSETLCCIELGS